MDYTINDFIAATAPQHQNFVKTTHEGLTATGCKLKIESKASGLFASYKHAKTKKSLANLLFRKSGLLVRLYPGNKTPEIPAALTATMIKEIDKAIDCKYCSEKCPKGYQFSVGSHAYDKCHYGAFLFAVTEESKPIVAAWLQREAE